MKFYVGVNSLLIWIFLNIRYLNAQNYLLEEEMDFESVTQIYPLTNVQKIITNLCHQYYFTIDENTIDCYNIILQSKSPDIDNRHLIVERDIHNDMEGSGNSYNEEIHIPPSSVISETQKNESAIPNSQLDKMNETKKEIKINETSSFNILKEYDTNNQTQTTKSNNNISSEITVDNSTGSSESTLSKNTSENSASTTPVPISRSSTVDNTSSTSITRRGTRRSNIDSSSSKPSTATTLSEMFSNITGRASSGSSSTSGNTSSNTANSSTITESSKITNLSITSPHQHVNVEVPKATSTQKVDQVPFKEATFSVNPLNNTDQIVKEKEQTNDRQSLNAILLNVPKYVEAAVEASETDEVIKKMRSSANINTKVATPDSPYTGESAEDTTKASKNSTILIVLFVAVLAVGTAAVIHRYIRKHKQKTSYTCNNENSMHTKNVDVEQGGAELKPLMKPQNNNENYDANEERKEISN